MKLKKKCSKLIKNKGCFRIGMSKTSILKQKWRIVGKN